MKSILRCLVILLLLVAALPLLVYAGSSNVTSAVAASGTPINTVTASSGWIVTPASIGHISANYPAVIHMCFRREDLPAQTRSAHIRSMKILTMFPINRLEK